MITVEPVRPEDLAQAFQLIFRHCDDDQRQTRTTNALELIRQGALDPKGVLVARSGESVRGAIVCTPLPAASGLIWPPQVIDDGDTQRIEDQLVSAASSWLRQRGARLAQSLLTTTEAPLGEALLRNGFRNVTKLWYMRHELELPPQLLGRPERLTYQTFAQCDTQLFQRTLLRSYDNTLDCPEVNGVRTIEEIVEGHKHQGVHDPERWWLALEEGRPVGVLITTAMPEFDGWDLAYLGVVEEARGRGIGREMTLKALYEAKAAEVRQLTLSVDARNRPAWNLYRSAGFEPYDQREVFLAIW